MPGFLQGFVLVKSRRIGTRVYRGKHARRFARPPQWTLHRAECFHVRRATGAVTVPAPQTPYPHTVACTMCKPGTGAAS